MAGWVAVMLVLGLSSVKAQSFSYRCGFETIGEVFDWTLVNGDETNKWCFGQAVACEGSYSLYVSSNGGRTNAFMPMQSIVYAYYDFTLPRGVINITYDYSNPYSNSNFASYLIPDPQGNPQAGVLLDSVLGHSTPNGWYNMGTGQMELYDERAESEGWHRRAHEYSIRAGNYRLLFVWNNPRGERGRNSIAIDNISIDVNPCRRPDGLFVIPLSDTSSVVTWAERGSATEWLVEYGNGYFEHGDSNGTLQRTNTNRFIVNGLASNSLYTVYVSSVCPNGGTSMPVGDTAHTFCSSLTLADLPYSTSFDNGDKFVVQGSNMFDLYDSRLATFYSCCMVRKGSLSSEYAKSGTLSVEMNAGTWIILPHYDGDLSRLMIKFNALRKRDLSQPKLEIGVVDSIFAPLSYTRLRGINIDRYEQWDGYCVSFSGYSGPGNIVIKIMGEGTIYVDDISLELAPPCPPVVDAQVQEVSSSSAMLKWQTALGFDQRHTGYSIACNNTTISTVGNRALIAPLSQDNIYTATITPMCDTAVGEPDSLTFKTLCRHGGVTNWYEGPKPPMDQWVLPMHYDWSRSVSQTIYTASELYGMGLVPGNVYGCAFNWQYIPIQGWYYYSHLHDLFFTLYVDTTSRSAYQGSQQNRRWLPIDSTIKYYSGTHDKAILGEEQLHFDHPFYWDGVSNIVMTFINSADNIDYVGAPVVPTEDTVSLLTYGPYVSYNVNRLPDTCMQRLPYRPDVRFFGDCDSSASGCGRPLLYVDSLVATTVRLRWLNASNETSWTVEHCDTNMVWVVDDTAATSQSYLYTSLAPDMHYYFRVTANCDDSVIQNHRSTVGALTQCDYAPIPLRESFDDWPVGANQASIPYCWHRGDDDGNASLNYPYITSDYSHSWQKSVCLVSGSGYQSWLVLPAVREDLRTLELSFSVMTRAGNYSREIIVGVMSDPDDISTFVPLHSVTPATDFVWETMAVPLSSSPLRGGYVAFLTPLMAESMAYVDDIELGLVNPCRYPRRFRVAGVGAGSVTLAWEADSAACAATIEYGVAGFEPGTGITVDATGCGITLSGLAPDTYDFYARRVCGSDTSLTMGPVQASLGRWNMRPQATDTMVLCGMELYDDSGPGINYSLAQSSTLTIVPQDSGSCLLLSGTYADSNYYDWQYDTIAVYDGMDRTAPCLFRATAYGETSIGPLLATNPQGALTVYFRNKEHGGGVGFHLHIECLDSFPVCNTPVGLAVSGTTYNSATVFWADTGLFEFAYKPASQRWWPHPSRDTASRYLLTGLHSIESYDWHVRRVCSLNVSDWAVSTFTTTQSPCTRPVQFRVSDTGMSDATLSWRSTADGEWQLRVLGMTLASPAGIDTVVAAPPVMVTGLLPHTEYRAVVRHLCDDTSASEWTDTLCFTTRHDTTLAITALDGQDFSVRVYPNPLGTGVQATVVVMGASDEAVLSLYDLSGRRLRRHAESCPEQCTLQFDVSDLAQGTYFVKVHTRTKSAVAKLVIMR